MTRSFQQILKAIVLKHIYRKQAKKNSRLLVTHMYSLAFVDNHVYSILSTHVNLHGIKVFFVNIGEADAWVCSSFLIRYQTAELYILCNPGEMFTLSFVLYVPRNNK